ncbi:MAG: hypothetical protein KF799_10225 [Bdellovibrionales bacterium]|nr:hypothetical protein [Bdellovibrionales bacterium]
MSLYRNSILFFCLMSSVAQAGLSVRSNLELSPQYRQLEQRGMTSINEVWDVFGLFNTHLEWSEGDWFVEAKPEIRAVGSRGVLQAVPAAVSVQTTDRVLSTRRILFRERDGEAQFDFDRLNVRRSFENGDIYFGRKPLSMGVLRFFPVWNKLTLPLVFQPGPEWIENPDVIGGSYQSGRFSHRLFGSRNADNDLVLYESRFAGEGVDLQALGGYWWESPVLGMAGAYDILASTLRLEALWIGRDRKVNPHQQTQLGLGFERALSEKWTLVAESLYQSAGLVDVTNTLAPPSPFMVLNGRWYVLGNFSYQIHPLWNLRFGALAALASDVSYVALGGFEHSLTDNTSLTFKIKWPFGNKHGEFGSDRYTLPLMGYRLGASRTVLLQLQSTF